MKSSQKKLNIFSKSELDYMNALAARTSKPYLTNDKILENIREYRISKDSIYLDRIINNFIKLLIKKARKYKKSGTNIGDLIHYGIEGLIEAVNKTFNLDGDERFITYITIIVERRMKDGLDIQRGAVMLPKNIMTQQRKLRYEFHEQSAQQYTKPSTIIPSKPVYSKMNIEDFLEFKDILSINQSNIFADSIEDKLDKESLQFDVFYILETILTPIEKDVIIHNFGLNGESAKAFDAISLLLGVSSQKVRKIRNAALTKIRNNPKSANILKKYFS